jgi:hypothetical protein
MRTSIMLALAATMVAASVDASVVRRNTFPENLQGTWAPTAEACIGGDGRVVVSAKQYTRADNACDLMWLTVTAAPNGANYSAQARCVEKTSGKASPPAALMFRPTDGNHLSIGMASGKTVVLQKCP